MLVHIARHPEGLPAIPDISSEYLTPLRADIHNDDKEEDATLFMAPVADSETGASVEYERLNLYTTIDL